ncbi:TPA: methyl-accepting chemotaxis protein [Legionella pneumophila]|nr:methyl-accepting chemotaxis protein [Legionella pneumophila]HAT8869448.1 methyl-accepting chemotaxis protein [Legionella pneumophila subsp. pneumophila]HAT7074200.1 methyl-accepting chemotaxis protein [Legionella pneumophila]HAT8643066.1 methyl-accepting chemotaxis protein [Legionella pneumophila]HAT8891177.1 methyl-accepting chemotaxis protein [Legionella pneumophila subsp. pneumophila]HAT8934644.1 methyl-accepting chemotaxis protein [Legionella pneumophila subsp. pneumophila]
MINPEYLFTLITKDSTVYFFVSFIFTIALIPFWQATYTIGKVNRAIKKSNELIKSLGNESPSKFYNEFENIKAQLNGIDYLKNIWGEFIGSTYYLTNNNTQQINSNRIFLSHRPSYYFNKESVLGSQLNLNQFFSFPNYLIGLGLAFTFIGLAAALHIAQSGLANGEGQTALSELLKVASVKFFSSITGIGCSLIISFIQKIRIKGFQNNLNNFCGLLEKCTEYKPAEKLIFESIQEEKTHTLALQSMANDISIGIGDVLNNQLPASVANALAPLADEIRALAQKFSGSNENALEKVLNEFLDQLRKSSGDEMQGLIDGVNTLKDSLLRLVENMETMGKSFGSNTKDSTDRLMASLDAFTSTFTPVQQGIGKFGQSLDSLENIARSIQQASGNITGAADISNQSMSNLAGTVTQITENLTPIQDLLNVINLSLKKVDESSENLHGAGRTIASAADGFKNSAESIEQASNRFDQKINKFEVVIDGISGTANVLERASSNVSNAIKPLSETSEGLTKVIHAIQETESRIHGSQKQLSDLLINLENFTEKLPSLLSQYEERFSKVDQDLANAFGELAKGSDEFRTSISQFVISFDQQFDKAIRQLSGVIQDLQEERENAELTTNNYHKAEYVDADTRIA